MVLDGIVLPASVEDVDPVEHLADELHGIDRAGALPGIWRELGMTADAVEDDPTPQDAVAQRRDAVRRRLGHDACVGLEAAIDHGERTHAADLLVHDCREYD